MAYDLIIKDGTVFMKEYKLTKKIELQELAKNLVSIQKEFETPELPLNTIKYKFNSKTNTYYILIPEDDYNIKYLSKMYTVRFPNTIFRFKFSSILTETSAREIKMYWTMDEKVDLKNGKFYIPPLANIFTNSSVCSGSYQRGTTQVETVTNFINHFFMNSFNNDMSGGKRRIADVAKDQSDLVKTIKNKHDLIKLWWYNKNNETISERPSVSSTFLEEQVI